LETMNVRVTDLRTFCYVVETGSLANAAKKLHETKSSVSRRITRLEGILEVKLFDRTARSSRVTEEGVTYYPYIRDAIMKIDDGTAVITKGAMDAEGLVRIAAPVDFAMTVMPKLLNRFLRDNPAIRTSLTSTDSVVDLAAKKVDIAIKITIEPSLPDMEYWATQAGLVRMGLFAAAKAKLPPLSTPKDLSKLQCVFPAYDGSSGILELLHETKDTMKIPANHDALIVSDYATLAQFLVEGDAYGALPLQVAQKYVDNGELVRVLPDWFLPNGYLWVVTRVSKNLTTRVRLCRMFLVEKFKEKLG